MDQTRAKVVRDVWQARGRRSFTLKHRAVGAGFIREGALKAAKGFAGKLRSQGCAATLNYEDGVATGVELVCQARTRLTRLSSVSRISRR